MARSGIRCVIAVKFQTTNDYKDLERMRKEAEEKVNQQL